MKLFGWSIGRPVVVVHIDREGRPRGVFLNGEADVLIIDERDPASRVHQMVEQTSRRDLRRMIGKHELGKLVEDSAGAEV
ncbi:hypothetical protein GC169_10600 [bacterium]|nr:hypothetical protein [bacterium]